MYKEDKMTPKEKAKKLVDSMFIEIGPVKWNYETRKKAERRAKQCALNCVDEIIEFGSNLNIREPMMFWNKVKEEINKL